MWTCKVCQQRLDADTQTFCHHCGIQRDIDDQEAGKITVQDLARKAAKSVICVRCAVPLRYVGMKRFHEGTRAWGFILGDLGELLTHREQYDVYLCQRCGKIEMFLDGVGEELRDEGPGHDQ